MKAAVEPVIQTNSQLRDISCPIVTN